MTSQDTIRLSCIIPAYERLDQFSRCLMSILTQDFEGLEVIVSDDSSSSRIEAFTALVASRWPAVRHVRGPRSGNPVDNWNAGLEAARGRYAVVVHQDEFFIDTGFLSCAVERLDRTGEAMVLGEVRPVSVGKGSRFGTGQRLAGDRPWLLFALNWIGPTACVVFRQRPGLLFDPALVNLVDVEFYYRTMAGHGPPHRLPGAAVAGLAHHPHQISARIDRHLLSYRELKDIILERHRLPHWQSALLLTMARARVGLRTTRVPPPIGTGSPPA